MPEVLLYGSINEYSAREFILAMNENAEQEIDVRINSGGGSPEYGWGMVTKFIEHQSAKKIKIDGQAHSMALFFLCYADDAEAIDTTQLCLHRAAYPEWYEGSFMDDAAWSNLDKVNKSLRAALEAKIDVKKFEALPIMKGKTLDDIFSNETRLEVYLSAQDAKKIGLINRVIKITPDKKAEVLSLMKKSMSEKEYVSIAAQVFKDAEVETENPKNKNIMTIEKLKAEFPALAAQLVAEGEAAGIAKEKDRVGSWMAFVDVDAKAVSEGIKSGASLSQTAMAEFSRKAMSAGAINDITEDGKTAKTETTEVKAATEKEAKISAFEQEVKDNLKK